MIKRALIGLGQSGSAIVKDIIPMLDNTEVFCINSCNLNIAFSNNIPEQNRFTFGLESGFSQEPKYCFEFLEENSDIRAKMIRWVLQILEKYDEVIFITFSPSGTGIGTLWSILKSNIRIAKKAIVLESNPLGFYREKFHEDQRWIEFLSSELDSLTFIPYEKEKELEIKEKLAYKLDLPTMRYTLLKELINNQK